MRRGVGFRLCPFLYLGVNSPTLTLFTAGSRDTSACSLAQHHFFADPIWVVLGPNRGAFVENAHGTHNLFYLFLFLLKLNIALRAKVLLFLISEPHSSQV
jgi:hypothetical protein